MKSLRLQMRQAAGEVLYRTVLHEPRRLSLSILMYHSLTAESYEDPTQESVPAELFELQMASLRRLGVEVVALEDAVSRLAACPSASDQQVPLVSVVFDDGYVGVYEHALASLVKHRIPATLFLPTQWIGRAAFPWSSTRLGRPMTWNEVSELVRTAGCSLGSHTHSHAVATRMSDPEIVEELRASKDAIEQETGMRTALFAYPFGSFGTFDARTRRILQEQGFIAACTSVWGQVYPGDDPLLLKRIRVSWCDSVREIRKSLAGCYNWYPLIQRRQRVPMSVAS